MRTNLIISFVGTVAFFAAFIAYCAFNPDEPKKVIEPPKTEKYVEELPVYVYPDGTKGSLSRHPFTKEKGILIEEL